MSDQRRAGVKIIGLFHDLVRKRSTVSVVWEDDPEKALHLVVPFGCPLDDVQAEAEKAIRELASAIATTPVRVVE